VPLDTTDIQTVLRTFREPAASPLGSVDEDSIAMHEVLGGNDPDRKLGTVSAVNAKSYFALWKARKVTVTPSTPKAGAAGTNAAPNPEIVIARAGVIAVGGAAGAVAPVGVPGILVRFRVTSGGGTLSAGGKSATVVDVVTDANGKAAVVWTFGPVPGLNEMVAKGFGVDHKFTVTST
jgi:hypothetical protein